MDGLFHYPPDVFNLLVDTIPRLCKSKQDVLLFLKGAGVADADLAGMQEQLRKDRESVKKFDIAREVLTKVNMRGEAGLRPRREIIKRVVEFEEFSMCWPNDLDRAKANVADLRKIVKAKDAFTKMKNAHDELQAEKAAQARAAHTAKLEQKRKVAEVRDRLNALFGMDSEPQKRGKLLEGVLNDLFRAYGIHVKEDFKRLDQGGTVVVEQIDGVIEFEGHTYLVEMKWLKDPVGVNELSSHFMRLFARPDVRGLFISTSDFASTSIAECHTHSANKTMVLASLREFVMLLLNERDLLQMLRAKVQAAVLEKKPFLEITA
jgi:restriction endonuclease Mrr